jgi:hypothetical protein
VVKPPKQGVSWRYRKPIVLLENVYPKIVSPKVWDAAQKRLKTLSEKGGRRPRIDGYPLAGVLFCAHCGKSMDGRHPTGRNYRSYCCSTPSRKGMGTCNSYEIHEELILPLVWKMLVETMGGDPKKLFPDAPNHHKSSNQNTQEDDAALDAEIAASERKIDLAENNLMTCEDESTLQSLLPKIAKMHDEHKLLIAERDRKKEAGYEQEEQHRRWLAAVQFWENYYRKCIQIPVDHEAHDHEYYISNAGKAETKKGTILWRVDGSKVKERQLYALVDPRMLNEMLHVVGTKVTLRWKTREVTLKNGKKQNRYEFRYGTFQLGQQTGKVVMKDGVMFREASIGAPCHDAF